MVPAITKPYRIKKPGRLNALPFGSVIEVMIIKQPLEASPAVITFGKYGELTSTDIPY
jgi:hypothetical protein